MKKLTIAVLTGLFIILTQQPINAENTATIVVQPMLNGTTITQDDCLIGLGVGSTSLPLPIPDQEILPYTETKVPYSVLEDFYYIKVSIITDNTPPTTPECVIDAGFDGDNKITLADAIIALQIVSGVR